MQYLRLSVAAIGIALATLLGAPEFLHAQGSVPYTNITGLPANSVLGSIAGGNASALTPTQLTTLCNTFTTTLPGCVPAPGSVSGKVLSDNGSWVSTPIYSSQYGTVCNGSTDDTTALSNWIAAINASTAASVTGIYGPGNCQLASSHASGLVITRSNVTIDGQGATITVTGTGTMNEVFSSSDQSNITYRNNNLVGNSVGAFATGGAIGFTNAAQNIQNLSIENNTFTNFGGNYTIYVETLGAFNNNIQNISIDHNSFFSRQGNCRDQPSIGVNCSFVLIYGVGHNGSTPTPNSFVQSIRITNNYMRADYIKTGIELFNNVQDAYVAGNQVYNAGQLGTGIVDDVGSYAIMAYENEETSPTLFSRRAIFEGNYVNNARDNCFYMAGSWNNSVFNGNVCEGQTSTASTTLPKGGISVNGAIGTTITNNRLWNIAADGITLVSPQGSVGSQWIIANNSVLASKDGAIKLINAAGGDTSEVSVTSNSLYPVSTAYGVSTQLFSVSGTTYTGLRIDDNKVAGGVECVRVFTNSGTTSLYYSSVSRNLCVTPSSVGIDVSQQSGGSMQLDSNVVSGSPITASYKIDNNRVITARDNACVRQSSGYCWVTQLAAGTLWGNTFDGVANANVVQTFDSTDLGRVKGSFTPSGSFYGIQVQNLVTIEAGTAGSKYLVTGWFYNNATAAWVDMRVLTGN
jgi:hypothetical protein